ncbi:hypothetical protein NE237_001976 [Protea cynaroides]|uniref:Disease resistance protein n=1 Tax=Protea cynaroides TaxID=273540 RepID=A0A9Q0QYM0_9MAGN|nr:hypothetical protein NE237_001976 [Protea cynaroides]
MAEGVVTFLIQKLGLLVLEEANLLLGVDKQIMSFHDELEWINSFLRDADEKRRIYKRVDVWVSQVRNLAYDADDIIDLFMLEVQQQRQRNIGLKCMCYPKHLFTLHKFVKQIDDVNSRIEKISANKSKYGIETLEAGQTSVPLNDGLACKLRRVSINEELEDVVGMKKDMEDLAMLLKKDESQQLRVVSIVAMGGSGKTTLAKSVYKRRDVQQCFDSYAWIYVSQEFTIKDLLLEAIKHIMQPTKEELEAKNEEGLGKILSDHLKERRCLLVFDDVWKKEDWDRIKEAFLPQVEGGKQWRVLLTTRNWEVAKHADPSSMPHELKPLNDKEGLELFLNKVYQFEERSSFTEDLKDRGKQLVAKCGGLPLAIVVLGGLLSTKDKTPEEWSKVLKSVSWQLSQDPYQCMHILALSYTNLPYYLQSCFLYFGLFPEDYEISCSKLIQLWVAEGFIQERGDETLEDIAEEYLEELIQRSLIQATSRRSNGGVQTCRIHDLLRDFAISESKKDKLLVIYGDKCSTSLNRFRRLAIHSSHDGKPRISAASLNHLHSLLCFSESLHKKFWKGLYLEFNLLRVLDLKDVQNIQSLPKEIGGFLLLKYLNLNGTSIRRIPHSMRNLSNLQTLDLSYTTLSYIPNEIWKMQQLRHLYVHGFYDTSSKLRKSLGKVVHVIGESYSHPPRIDNLRNLQTLLLEAGSWIKGGLDKLTNLRELDIEGDLTLYTKALTVSIPELKKLQTLRLYDASNENTPLPFVSFSHHVHLKDLRLGGVLEKLPEPKDFPPYLTKLQLRKSRLKQDDQPMATLEKLPNLKILELYWISFDGKEMICSGGGFAKLQTLELSSLNNLEDLKVEQGAFPCLKVFNIFQCRQLKMLPDGLRHVTTLQELGIWSMPKEFEAKVKQETGEEWEKTKHIPSVSVRYTHDD